MSRIGKLPISIPNGVEVNIHDESISVSGKLGLLDTKINKNVKINYSKDNNQVIVIPNSNEKKSKAMWGLYRSIIYNMVKGVTDGFVIKLEINGVGYRANTDDKVLTLFLGFSHEIKYLIPDDIDIKCEKPTLLQISGKDKQKVGQIAAIIRGLRPPEPYKGKGIKYENENIKRKVGKKK